MPGVLTSKQCWRRQSRSSRTNRHHYDLYEKQVSFDLCGQTDSSASISSITSDNSTPFAPSSGSHSSKQPILSNIPELKIGSQKKKSVIFSARVHVVLIPNISEYCAAHLAPHLWWTEEEYKEIKVDALNELKAFMLSRQIDNTKEALKQIYHVNSKHEEEKSDTNSSECFQAPIQCQSDTKNPSIRITITDEAKNQTRDLLQQFLSFKTKGLEMSLSTNSNSSAQSNFSHSHDQVHPVALICL